jgi:RNA polymerase sigma factor (sigma-70 family)
VDLSDRAQPLPRHLARAARDQRIAERWRAETPSSLAPDRSDLDQLAAALQALPPDQREVLVLCRYHDLPFAEVAEILGCTPGAARVRAHRALAAVRNAYVARERSRSRV